MLQNSNLKFRANECWQKNNLYGGPIGTHQRFLVRYRSNPWPHTAPSPRLEVRNLQPKLQGLPEFFGYPLLLQERVKLYWLQIWQVHSQSSFEQNPLKFWRKGSVGISGGCPNFWVPLGPIIPGTGKATDFKFCTQIHRVDLSKSPWKILLR